jgi:putative PIN family toxin of toxin-antitoxin system
MRYVILDTNVLVSALISPGGNPAAILGMVSDGKIKAVYNRSIFDEFTKVLTRPRFQFPCSTVNEALDIFLQFGIQLQPEKSTVPMTDESDRIFYDTAVISGAVLITGNLKHYPEGPFIVSPADYCSDPGRF